MTGDEAKLRLLEGAIKKRIPQFEVRWKNKGPGSAGQKVISRLIWLFNRQYMTEYISTFYPRVYWPSSLDYWKNPASSLETLAHEGVHLFDGHDHRFWFGFSYLLPALFALLSLGALAAIWASNWFLLFLAALACLLPLPAYWRMRWELRGYAMSMAVDAWRNGSVTAATKRMTLDNFTGSAYYFMWPFRKGMERRLDEAEKSIHNGDILQWSPLFPQVHRICKLSDSEAIALVERGI